MKTAELDRAWGYVARTLGLRFTPRRGSHFGEDCVIEGAMHGVQVRIDVVPAPATPSSPSTRFSAVASADPPRSFALTLSQLGAQPPIGAGESATNVGHGAFDATFHARMRTTSLGFTRALLRGPLTDALLQWSHFGFTLDGNHATATGAGVILDPDTLAAVLHIVVMLAKAPARVHAAWSALASQLGGQFAHFDILQKEATLPQITLQRHGVPIVLDATDEPSHVRVTRLAGAGPGTPSPLPLSPTARPSQLRVAANVADIEDALEILVATSSQSPYRG